ncbi:hypothetical protein Aca07nite_49120 [Actinoplanes capillaceus]|uniref:Uncharacterized protein n=1 Tax=Actinoplanes campanulatus TaxID=113559 RepID=A0ABQ3WN41_9ACTN|nr:hypothetical protein [Actinoplanes capillaceus]GID47637.1 hypothetical protein Aca07nite_49120 [Actinoplanes capillaceus]
MGRRDETAIEYARRTAASTKGGPWQDRRKALITAVEKRGQELGMSRDQVTRATITASLIDALHGGR